MALPSNPIAVLVVDDEKPIRDFVQRNLDIRGYRVYTAANGLEALETLQAHPVDLVILDIMMPHMDGLETIRRIRQTSTVPIIILSALGEEADKIQALNLGADDYLTKPFGVGELLARVKAALRRARWAESPTPTETLAFGPIVLDPLRRQVTVEGQSVELTPIEFNLLAYLMSHAGQVLSHQDILQHVWGPEYGRETEYLRVYIGRLRQKIEPDPEHPRFLRTMRGVGYLFEPEA